MLHFKSLVLAYRGKMQKNCVTVKILMDAGVYFTVIGGPWVIKKKPDNPWLSQFSISIFSIGKLFWFNSHKRQKIYSIGMLVGEGESSCHKDLPQWFVMILLKQWKQVEKVIPVTAECAAASRSSELTICCSVLIGKYWICPLWVTAIYTHARTHTHHMRWTCTDSKLTINLNLP